MDADSTQKPLSVILDEIEERASKATGGPWKKCSASEGRCRCHAIWSVPADAPVCECNDKWGDPFASLRFVGSDGPGTIGAKVEACEDMIEYGDIGEENKQANKDFIASARTDVPALVKALRRAMDAIDELNGARSDTVGYSAIKDITTILNQGRSVGDNKGSAA